MHPGSTNEIDAPPVRDAGVKVVTADYSYPLEDIRKTRKVEFVITNGTMESSAELWKTWDLTFKSEAPIGRTSRFFVRGMGINDGH